MSSTLRETSCLWSLEKSGAHKILAGSSPTLTQYVPMYFGKKMWIKKQHIGRIFGFILKFSRKWQV
jgi:hypothetical protein